ncbi:acyltransferase [Methylobacterium mesophilicum]|nr:acyltransferase [Methylobacterium mesophilicum]
MILYGYRLSPSACIWAGATIKSKKLVVGNETFINYGFFFDGAGDLSIGKNVRIGQFFRVITATHEVGPSEQRCNIEAIIKPVSIEDGCWIGANVTVMPGVTIKRGCVIGANSLVVESTDEDCLYYGTPARRIKNFEGNVN